MNSTAIKERPILCYPHEAKALVTGQLRQLRRPLSTQPLDVLPMESDMQGRAWVGLLQRDPNHGIVFGCRYGLPGDRLWVRETWCLRPEGYGYRADNDPSNRPHRWGPSSSMPREACRFLLEITRVRVERVQSIATTRETQWDIVAEGAWPREWTCCDGNDRRDYQKLWDKLHALRGFG